MTDAANTDTTLLDDAFEVLARAVELEDIAGDRDDTLMQASSKYYEAVYLIKKCLNRLPIEPSSPKSDDRARTRELIQSKCRHYENHAQELLQRVGSEQSEAGDRRSWVQQQNMSAPHDGAPASAPEQSDIVAEKAAAANVLLENALDHDENGRYEESIASYMSAAELYLEAIKTSEGNNDTSAEYVGIKATKRKLEGIMDRVEQLKKHPGQKKKEVPQTSAPTQSLTAEEISVLKRSSMIASGLFMPWSDDEAQTFEYSTPNGRPWRDPDGVPNLSDKQKLRLYKWARPHEILSLRGQPRSSLNMVKSITPFSIQQHAVQDCSFIASLCICAEFERRFKRSLVTSLIYPQDSSGNPIINNSGIYMVKLWLNGVPRRVLVDDTFPVDKYGNMLCSHSKVKSGLELWVSIIEKAYMKLCGGYDFPGSNSGVDMFSLTGWIPERIFFPEDPTGNNIRDFECPPERAWERLYSATSFGDCLITMSTSNDIPESKAEEVGLVTGHAYAVLSCIKTRNGTRLLQLKNPWAHKGWKGRFSCFDKTSWSDASFRNEVGYNPTTHGHFDDGVFWISYEDVLIYFRNIHLSWNPSLFSYRNTIHASWPNSIGPADDSFNLGENPQYILTLSDAALEKGASCWILISRHVTKQEQEGMDVTDYLTIHIHRSDRRKERIYYPGGSSCVFTGAYTNNCHVLIRYDAKGPNDKYLALILSQYKKSNDLNYTLSCYCTAPFQLGKPQKDPQNCVSLRSEWTAQSAGGPPGSSGFGTNPMWSVAVAPDRFGKTFVQLTCTAPKTTAVNVMLIPVDRAGKRVRRVEQEPVIDTGDFRHGFVASGLVYVPEGQYTLVVSSYYPGQVGTFTLKMLSTTKLKAVPIAL